MEQTLGEDAEEAMKALTKNGIPRGVAKKALEIAEQKGRFTIFALVDALTRMAREQENADDRTDADEKASAQGFVEVPRVESIGVASARTDCHKERVYFTDNYTIDIRMSLPGVDRQ